MPDVVKMNIWVVSNRRNSGMEIESNHCLLLPRLQVFQSCRNYRFRLICCRSSTLSVPESNCRQAETNTQKNFTEKLHDGEVIHKVGSKFSLWQSDRKFVIDRRWILTICKTANATVNAAPDASTENGNDTAEADGSDGAQPAPKSLSETCKTIADGFSESDPPSGPEIVKPGRTTPVFNSFRIYCPNGHAIKSVRVVSKLDFVRNRKDTTFSVQCERLPLDEDITVRALASCCSRSPLDGITCLFQLCPVKRKELAFKEDNDLREMSSLQSPCDPNTGQFLCGLSGIYHNNNRR